MNKEDARKLLPSAQEEKRKLVIKLRKKDQLIQTAAETIGACIKRYKLEGPASLIARNRSPETGTTRQLTQEHEMHLQKLIADKSADQIMLACAL
ncbi:MAG: hypothetical protein KZQ78_12625 [Candidatus Thiodiazotropha sp. (ex Ustalcina ferruginea)]|nr:hypothetical protein [Candidatus Thiodiazotropha sp. (ex Ustalcina ferruginea)]